MNSRSCCANSVARSYKIQLTVVIFLANVVAIIVVLCYEAIWHACGGVEHLTLSLVRHMPVLPSYSLLYPS